jgi:hypothetical protein
MTRDFFAGRDAVLGQRVTVSTGDPVEAFGQLVVAFGGRELARRYVAELMLAARLEVVGR